MQAVSAQVMMAPQVMLIADAVIMRALSEATYRVPFAPEHQDDP
jgi:hypothetical protein